MFFFYLYGAHRDLTVLTHSFPPRRSSGLVAPGHLAGQLQRGLDGVGAGRAGELKAIVEAARLQDDILESRDEGGLGLGIHVEAVRDAVAPDVVDRKSTRLNSSH